MLPCVRASEVVLMDTAAVPDGVDHRPGVERDLGEWYDSYEGAHEDGESGGVASCAEDVGGYSLANVIAEHEDSDSGCCGVEEDLERLAAIGAGATDGGTGLR